jgi:hypothetical protein
MKTSELFLYLSSGLLTLLSAQAQGNFQNLNFELANLLNPSGIYNEVPISSTLPAWSASIGGVPVTEVWANDYSGGTATIDVFGPSWNLVDPGVIDGNYTVYLQAFNIGQGNVSLWQNGTIPANAASLQFSAWQFPSANQAFSVSFAGNNLSPVLLTSGQNPSGQTYDVYAVNIAPYAGQTGQIEFTSLAGNGEAGLELDDITFSTIPEPGTLALLFMGGMAFGVRSWRKRVKASRQNHRA